MLWILLAIHIHGAEGRAPACFSEQGVEILAQIQELGPTKIIEMGQRVRIIDKKGSHPVEGIFVGHVADAFGEGKDGLVLSIGAPSNVGIYAEDLVRFEYVGKETLPSLSFGDVEVSLIQSQRGPSCMTHATFNCFSLLRRMGMESGKQSRLRLSQRFFQRLTKLFYPEKGSLRARYLGFRKIYPREAQHRALTALFKEFKIPQVLTYSKDEALEHMMAGHPALISYPTKKKSVIHSRTNPTDQEMVWRDGGGQTTKSLTRLRMMSPYDMEGAPEDLHIVLGVRAFEVEGTKMVLVMDSGLDEVRGHAPVTLIPEEELRDGWGEEVRYHLVGKSP